MRIQMRIRMRIRMRILVTKMIRIHADPDPQHCVVPVPRVAGVEAAWVHWAPG
jgi:hypothetical protein